MKGEVFGERHVSVNDLLAHHVKFGNRAERFVHAELGEIEVFTPFLDIVSHRPHGRRYGAIPWPSGLVGVTIKARALKDGPDIFRNMHDRIDRIGGIDGRVCPIGSEELD